jgi:hypothetical protein
VRNVIVKGSNVVISVQKYLDSLALLNIILPLTLVRGPVLKDAHTKTMSHPSLVLSFVSLTINIFVWAKVVSQ